MSKENISNVSLFQYKVTNYLNQIVYDYLETYIGYDKLLDSIARMHLCGINLTSNPFGHYDESNSIIIDTDEISDSTGVYKIMGVFEYDGSNLFFDYNVSVSYKFIDNYMRCSHLDTENFNDDRYYLSINDINIDIDCDLSEFKYLYYLLDYYLNYDIDFGGRGVYVVNFNSSHLLNLMERNDELIKSIFDLKCLPFHESPFHLSEFNGSELLRVSSSIKLKDYKTLYNLNARVLNKSLYFLFSLNDFDSEITFMESGKSLGEENLVLGLTMIQLNSIYFRKNPKMIEFCNYYNRPYRVSEKRLIKSLPTLDFKRDNVTLHLIKMDKNLTPLLDKYRDALSSKFKHVLVSYKIGGSVDNRV